MFVTYSYVFGINVDILSFSFQCSLMFNLFILLHLFLEVNNFLNDYFIYSYIVFIVISMVSFTLLKFFFKNNCVVFDDFIILSTLEFKVNNFLKLFVFTTRFFSTRLLLNTRTYFTSIPKQINIKTYKIKVILYV